MRSAKLKKVGAETMCFMRGKYELDEIGNDKDELSFRSGDETVLTIFIRKSHYDFQVGQQTVRVTNLASLEEAKRLILAQKEPNRTPFPKENAVYAKCGHRCDLCQHYVGGSNSEEFRAMLIEHVRRVYGGDPGDAIPDCQGCEHGGFAHAEDECWQKKCAAKKGLTRCQDCRKYTSECNPGVSYAHDIEPRSRTADDVTWAILPYVSGQYGN